MKLVLTPLAVLALVGASFGQCPNGCPTTGRTVTRVRSVQNFALPAPAVRSYVLMPTPPAAPAVVVPAKPLPVGPMAPVPVCPPALMQTEEPGLARLHLAHRLLAFPCGVLHAVFQPVQRVVVKIKTRARVGCP